MDRFSPARILVVMGVCGSGKSTVGIALSRHLGITFEDADDYHSPANVEKMSQGIALDDEDRWPWLDALGIALGQKAQTGNQVVAACSALRRCYRERLLKAADEPILFIYLKGSREAIVARMMTRKDHFMPTQLLDSQLTTLEEPDADENAIVLSIDTPVVELVEQIQSRLHRPDNGAIARG